MAEYPLESGSEDEQAARLVASSRGLGVSQHVFTRRRIAACFTGLGLVAISAMTRPATIHVGKSSSSDLPEKKFLTGPEQERAWAALGGRAQAGMMNLDQENAQSGKLVAHAQCDRHPQCGRTTGICCPNEEGIMLDCCGYHVLDYEHVLSWRSFRIRRDYHPDPPWRSSPPKPGWTYWNPHNVQVVDDSLQVCVRKNSGFQYVWQHGIVPSDAPLQAWANGEAVFEDTLYYGDYSVQFNLVDPSGKAVMDRLLTKDVTFTAGVFIFDLTEGGEGENKHRELDLIEVGYQNQNNLDPKAWINNQPGGPAISQSHAHFALQPVKIFDDKDGSAQSSNWDHVHRISLDSAKIAEKDGLTVVMRWHGPGKAVSFWSAPGAFTSEDFPFKGENTTTWTTPASAIPDVPSRTDSMRLHLNLWAYGGPASEQSFCMKVSNVEIPPKNTSNANTAALNQATLTTETSIAEDVVTDGSTPAPSAVTAETTQTTTVADLGLNLTTGAPTMRDPAYVSLYCFALMLPHGPERGLLEAAAQVHEGIFGCDEWDIWSSSAGSVGGTQIKQLVGVNLSVPMAATPRKYGGDGKSLSPANAGIFKLLWQTILKEGRWKEHDWIVKVDPDTVMLTARLRSSLSSSWHRKGADNPKGAYVVNCAYGMYGSIEVISRHALQTLNTDIGKCQPVSIIPQEDVWIRACFGSMGVWPQNNYEGFCMEHCDKLMTDSLLRKKELPSSKLCPDEYSQCGGLHAAFHPFRTPRAYRQCVQAARNYAHALGLE
eukprot:TRINITY_DN21789_c0_g1_i1.p1 TRINITY_DN21789_c0_g1~~TRINITY_DN21789_c0_g1_i1.p1  ORF type:complete len:769 (-),score=112.98 TRINITY_DN21789_c0_g1_i1:409-2715(-)